MKNESTCTPGLITGTPPPVEQTVESKGSHATLIPLLTETAPFGLMKVLTAIRDNDVTRLYQEWRYLRDDRIVKTPYHEFAEQMDAEIDAGVKVSPGDQNEYLDVVIATLQQATTITIDDGTVHCSECFSTSQDDYRGVAMPEGCKDEDCDCHITFTDGTTAPLKSGVIPSGVKFNAIALIAVNIGIGLLMGVFAFVPAETVLANIQWAWRAI